MTAPAATPGKVKVCDCPGEPYTPVTEADRNPACPIHGDQPAPPARGWEWIFHSAADGSPWVRCERPPDCGIPGKHIPMVPAAALDAARKELEAVKAERDDSINRYMVESRRGDVMREEIARLRKELEAARERSLKMIHLLGIAQQYLLASELPQEVVDGFFAKVKEVVP